MRLDTNNKTILLFSDPHQEIDRVEYLLKRENYDIAVCLGDWFDSFDYNETEHVKQTCKFLKNWIFKDNFYTCWGNHDLPYFYDNPHTIVSGYTTEKNKLISKLIGNFIVPIREKFLWYLWIDDFLCSHAGLNPVHIPPFQHVETENLSTWLNRQTNVADMCLINGGYNWMYVAGESRGGRAKIGGITWQDFDVEFEPIDGLKQIVGHSHHPTVLPHVTDGNLNYAECDNLDIDCGINEYLMIYKGKVTIKKYIDL